MEHLAQAYWRPVYAFIRTRWSLDPDTALDRTQEFFLWMLESDIVRRADPARGRFRALVKSSLQNWLVDQDRAEHAAKRGGEVALLSIDHDDLRVTADPFDIADATQLAPEAVLDQRWRRELLGRALLDVEQEFEAEGRSDWWRLFRDYFVEPDPDIDYRTLAQRYGIELHDVSNRLRRAKTRFRARLRHLVTETVTSAEGLEAELGWLFDEA